MAITISGENNNDKILASDGVIDQISGFSVVGVMTATSFTGDLTGNVVGNVTGNINNSTLLLQTGGSERIRITGNNEIGIAGANYGSAGQVLTSGGSGSAVTWSSIPSQVSIANNADNRVITGGSGVNLNGESNLNFDGTKLGININAPSAPLEIRGESGTNDAAIYFRRDGNPPNNGVIGQLLFRKGTDSVAIIQALKESANDDAYISMLTQPTGGSIAERLRIHSDGKMSLGTTSSTTAKFNISHGNEFGLYTSGPYNFQAKFESTDAEAAIVIEDSNSTNDGNRIGVITNDMTFITDNDERLRITSGGNVAINKTTAISAKLHIGDTSNDGALSQLVKLANDSSGSGTGAQLNLGAGNANESTAACIGGFYDGTGTSFIVKTAGTYANQSTVGERLRITSTGNVGIGGLSDVEKKVDIHTGDGGSVVIRPNGNSNGSRGNANAVNNLLVMRMSYGDNAATSANAGARIGLQFTGRNDSAGYADDPGKSASVYGVSEDSSAGYTRKMGLAFYTSAFDAAQTERLRITSDGRSLFNTTSTTNTDDFLTLKRPASGHSAISMTVDATTATGSYANAFIFTKSKGYYYNGLVFSSSEKHEGGIVGKTTGSGSNDPSIEVRVGGTGINASDTLAMNINHSGYVTKPAHPSFHARLINHKNATQNPLVFDDVIVNVGSHYKSSGSDAGKFVAPIAGTYFFFWEAIKNSLSGSVTRLYIKKNGNRTYNSMHLRLQEEGAYANGCMNVIMTLAAGDKIHIDLAVGGVHASEYTHFGGYLIG